MSEQGLRLLALDGGGVRGLSSLQILKQLMRIVNPESPPKPCDYFDMIGGTSTGGLLAIMLGRLQMTVDECIEAYAALSDKVFQKRRHRLTLKGKVQGRFDSSELERTIKSIIKQAGLKEDAPFIDSNGKCKVFVCATSKETGCTVRLTTYQSPRRLLRSPLIWEAARATTAASSFFDPITIGGFQEEFLDGGTGANNPVYELWNEAQDIWPSEFSLEDRILCLVSIGTGLRSLTPFGGDLSGIVRSLKAIATDTERTAEMFCRDKCKLDFEGRYYRFNVNQGLEKIGLEDSKQKGAIIAATDRYIDSQAVYKQMQTCGYSLAERQYVGSYRVEFSLDGVPLVNQFVNRPSEMECLERYLLPTRQKNRRKILVLNGLGGIGKTQLSVEFARRHHSVFSLVLWLDARNEDSVKRSIATVATRVPRGQIPESSRTWTAGHHNEIDSVIRDVMEWLCKAGNHSWLLIFDNVDEDPIDSHSYDVKHYFPNADHGSILLTTRLVSMERLGASLRLGTASREQALTMFRNGYGRNFEESDESRTLLAMLDGLPLGIAQASAFMRQTWTSFRDYIKLYNEQWKELHKSNVPLQEYQNEGIGTTWKVSYKDIRKKDETAANLLLLWASLDNKELWFELLQPAFAGRALRKKDEPQWVQRIGGNKLAFLNSVKTLLGYSLIEGIEGSSGYSMHPVVHEWAWQMQEEYQRSEFTRLAAIVVGFAFLGCDKSQREFWNMQRQLLPHADICTLRMSQLGIQNDASRYLQIQSNVNIENASIDTLFIVLPLIGELYVDQGKLVEAELLYQLTLDGREKVLGTEHELTLDTYNSFGNLYADQGKIVEAEAMYQQSLNGKEKVLGTNHTSTLTTVNNLGIIYESQGNLVEAEKMLRRALDGKEKAFGFEDVSTLKTVHNLAGLYKTQGKPVEAEALYERALEGVEKVLGADHTLTLSILNDLSNLYKLWGMLDDAESLYTRVLSGWEKTIGAEHITAFGTLNNLGSLYIDQGKLAEAEVALLRALEGTEKALGAEHISTINVVSNIGCLYERRGNLVEAEEMYLRALRGRERILGLNHPTTILTKERLQLLRGD